MSQRELDWQAAGATAAAKLGHEANAVMDYDDVLQECLLAAWRWRLRAESMGELVIIAMRRGGYDAIRRLFYRSEGGRKTHRRHYRQPHVHISSLPFDGEACCASLLVWDTPPPPPDEFERLIADVPVEWRPYVTMKFRDGLSNGEIARRQGTKPTRVSQIIHRAVKRVRELKQLEGAFA